MNKQPSKRARTAFLWRRLLDNKTEYDSLTLKEKPNMSAIKMMLDMNRDDDVVRSNIRLLEDYENEIKKSDNQEKTSMYRQKSMVRVDGYEGAVQIGRAYSASKMAWMPRKISNTIYKPTHVELDIVNSTPSILLSLFRDLYLPSISTYVNQQSTTMKAFYDEFGIPATAMKKAVLRLIGSHPKTCMATLDVDQRRDLMDNEFIQGFIQDLNKISSSIREKYPRFYEMVSTKAHGEGKADRVQGIAMSMLAQDVEHSVMRSVLDRIRDPEIWFFDGVIMPKNSIGDKTYEEFCYEMSSVVKRETGIDVLFKIKSLEENSLAWSISPGEMHSMSKYDLWKNRFDKQFVIFKNPPRFGRINRGNVDMLDAQGFNHLTMCEPPDMIKEWKRDVSKRIYDSTEFAPPPLVAREGNYNTWDGFAAELLAPIHDQQEVEERCRLYRDHVHLLMGLEDVNTEYFHKLVAFKIQNPGYNWGVMPFIRSTQGVGKDQWFKFISSIVGSRYCLSVTNISDVMGKSSGIMENKLFVSFSEVCYEDSRRNEENLKKLITDDHMIVERKYVPSYENRMTACLVAFSNNFGGIRVSMDDRRYFPVTASGRYANDPEYHGPFNAYIKEKENQRAVFQWLKEMSLGDFQPMAMRPTTETFMEMTKQNQPFFDIFLVKRFEGLVEMATRSPSTDLRMSRQETLLCLEVSASVLWSEYAEVLEELKIPNLSDSRAKVEKMGSRQLSEFRCRCERYKKLNMKHVIMSKRYSNRRCWLWDVEAVREYIKNTNSSD
jgi:hypothetical protein